VAALAEALMQNSMSPDFTSCRTCGSWPSWGAGILVDQHRALAELLQLVGEHVADDAVAVVLGWS